MNQVAWRAPAPAREIAQPYLSMTVGHNLGERNALFLSLGIGASQGSCFDVGRSGCAASDSFSRSPC